MARRHRVDTFQQFTDAVTADRVRSVADFWALRDHTGGCLPSFAPIELGLDFPRCCTGMRR